MKRGRFTVSAVLLLVVALASPASAEFGAVDDVRGAILLLPYFEIDLGDPNGSDTRFSIHNDSAAPIIADVDLYTDWGVPTLTFSVFLAPRAVQEVRLRDVFAGLFPSGEAPPQCQQLGPLDPEDVAGAVAAHRGEPSDLFGESCGGQPFGDGLLRGFALIEFPSECSVLGAPVPQGATQGGQLELNLLWGDYLLLDRSAGVAAGELLPSSEFPGVLLGSDATTSGGGPALMELAIYPSRWGVSFVDTRSRTTDVIVWRVPFAFPDSPRNCGSMPDWFPLGQTVLRAYDDDGTFADLDSFRPFPIVANRVPVGTLSLPTPYASGWMEIELIPDFELALSGKVFQPSLPAYVAVLQMDDDGATLRRAINFGPSELE